MTSQNVINMPTNEDIEQAKESSRKLSKFHNADRVKLSIEGSNEETESFVLPGIVMQMLLDILSEFSKGNAIGVIPHKAELSTQQAANLLNVSRPYLVKLLEEGKIEHTKVGTHRRVLVGDLLSYKEKIDAARNKSLDALSELSQELDMGY
ncbi:MAG: excisionase family DNA binding protein [Arenicella sp.]|jgi:excisionase family DNA binding protein